MGILSRVLDPRGYRRARPATSRAGKRVSSSKTTKGVRRRMRRLRNALHRLPRWLTRNNRSRKNRSRKNRSLSGKKLVAVYHHGTCTVNHRSRKAASRCRRTY